MYIYIQRERERERERMTTYENSANHFYNYLKIIKNKINMKFLLSNLQKNKENKL